MDHEDFDEQNLPRFNLPESFLEQLFDFSGSTDGNRGFMLAFVNQDGEPMIYSKTDNQIIDLGLRKAIEKYLIQLEESELSNGNGEFN